MLIDLSGTPQGKAAAASPFIRDTDAQRFEQDVLAISMHTPVIVDFWAPWCGPCKQMMPVLEKIVTENNGAVQMVKVDIDRAPELAQVFRVQSVPMVYAFFQGQPVDGFTGAKPESEIRAFIEKLKKLSGTAGAAPGIDITPIMQAADKFFKDGDYTNAMAQYSTALDAVPDNMDAMAGIGWCFIEQGEMDGVREILAQLEPEQLKNQRIKGLSFILSESESAAALEDLAALTAKIDQNPKNHAARYDLARRKMAAADLNGAIDALVELTRRDREWENQKARTLLLGLFDAMGPGHPLTAQGRRKLSGVLFS